MKKSWIAAAMLALASCSPEVVDWSKVPDEKIYADGVAEIRKENWAGAVQNLQNIGLAHPYSKYIGRAEIMMGYAQYRDGKHKEASTHFETFLKFQPSAPDVPYALYMHAMSQYGMMRPVQREQKETANALKLMEQLVREWPKTEYAEAVGPLIVRARNTLAGKEMHTAKELARGRNIFAALNRYQIVATRYANTAWAPEALFRAAEIYDMAGEPGEAAKLRAQLSEKYPGNEWSGTNQ